MDDSFRLGEGNTYLDLRYLWGKSYEEKGRYGYYSLEAGIRCFLEGNEVDQFRFDGTWFHPFSSVWGFQATLSAIESFSISTSPGRKGFSLFKAGGGYGIFPFLQNRNHASEYLGYFGKKYRGTVPTWSLFSARESGGEELCFSGKS